MQSLCERYLSICVYVCACVCMQVTLQQEPISPKSLYLVHECTYGPHICTSNISKMVTILKKKYGHFSNFTYFAPQQEPIGPKSLYLVHECTYGPHMRTSNISKMATISKKNMDIFQILPISLYSKNQYIGYMNAPMTSHIHMNIFKTYGYFLLFFKFCVYHSLQQE